VTATGASPWSAKKGGLASRSGSMRPGSGKRWTGIHPLPSMATPHPPFRADHVGSLLRPPALKALRQKKESGQASAEELALAEDAAIRDAVTLQQGIGLQGITDGEMRRKSWHMDFLLQLGGLGSAGKTLPVAFHGRTGDLFLQRPDLQISGRVTRPITIFVVVLTLLNTVSRS